MVASRRVRAAMAAAGICLLGGIVTAGQERPAAGPAAGVALAEEVFKSVTLLRGIPVDTFFDAMGMFAAAMGNDCTFCHSPKAVFDRAAFAEATPRLQRARQMIVMMNALNKQYFGGEPRVTCFTCHRGSQSPIGDPDFTVQYGPPIENPNSRVFAVDTRVTADQVFDRYVEAVGGAERLSRLTSIAATGVYSGFDTSFEKVPVELFARAPGQQTLVVRLASGVSTRTFDGRAGWMAGPDTPVPLLTLSDGNLDRARLEAMANFPAALRNAFSQWRVGRTAIDDREVQVVQGLVDGQAAANFYFDEAGLLVRLVRWTRTPVGFVPTQIEYSDYREVAGVKVPFHRVVTQTYMQTTVDLSDVQLDVAIDASRFAKPAAGARLLP